MDGISILQRPANAADERQLIAEIIVLYLTAYIATIPAIANHRRQCVLLLQQRSHVINLVLRAFVVAGITWCK